MQVHLIFIAVQKNRQHKMHCLLTFIQRKPVNYCANNSSRLLCAIVKPSLKPISIIFSRSASLEKVISTVTFVPVSVLLNSFFHCMLGISEVLLLSSSQNELMAVKLL